MSDKRVLIVEDEPKLIHLLREIFTVAGFVVCAAHKGETAVEMAALEQPDLIILDVLLPGEIDGYEVARRVRAFSDVPIIMLTVQSSEAHILRGFDVGVDDYVTKPFNSKELLARARSVLKRATQQKDVVAGPEIVCGELRIDLARRRVSIGERDIHLTRTEFNLLNELARHPNQVLTHEQLLVEVWGAGYRDDVEYLRAYVRYLRQKLESDPSNPILIVTSLGVGYMLACSDE